MKKLILSTSHDSLVARLTMNSPENLNAMDDAMASAFREARAKLAQQQLRAIVITGKGRAFSAGGDLAMLHAKSQKDLATNQREMLEFYRSFLALRDLNVPLICALQGHAVGAGLCFAAGCDLRIAARDAMFAAPFTRLGLHPGMGGSFFLPRSLGSEVARELLLTGRRLGASEAKTLGFVSAVVEDEKLEEALSETLAGILASAPKATEALLKSQRDAERPHLEAALLQEAKEQAQCYARPEFVEGLNAVAEKRTPVWP